MLKSFDIDLEDSSVKFDHLRRRRGDLSTAASKEHGVDNPSSETAIGAAVPVFTQSCSGAFIQPKT